MAKKDKVRLDVQAPAPSLTQNPFAQLRGLAGSSAEKAAPAGDVAPAVATSTSAAAAVVTPRDAGAAGKSVGRLILRRETKHRGGKSVVIISGLETARAGAPTADALALELKSQLGCGGTVEAGAKGPEIVLQGDRPARVAELLRARGFRVDGVTS
ncbi:MAG: translation initiation factor [Deltaproteobacteria bacterium]|nr:translation initiation factor [Deltaproteobacteria bacterium]